MLIVTQVMFVKKKKKGLYFQLWSAEKNKKLKIFDNIYIMWIYINENYRLCL